MYAGTGEAAVDKKPQTLPQGTHVYCTCTHPHRVCLTYKITVFKQS